MAHEAATQPPNDLASKAYQVVARYDGSNRAGAEQEIRAIVGSDPNACQHTSQNLTRTTGAENEQQKNPDALLAVQMSHATQARTQDRPITTTIPTKTVDLRNARRRVVPKTIKALTDNENALGITTDAHLLLPPRAAAATPILNLGENVPTPLSSPGPINPLFDPSLTIDRSSRKPWQLATTTLKGDESETPSEISKNTATCRISRPRSGKPCSATTLWTCKKLSAEWSPQSEIPEKLPLLEGWRSDMEKNHRPNQSPTQTIGDTLSISIEAPSSTLSLTAMKSCSHIENTSPTPSASSLLNTTPRSLSSNNDAEISTREPTRKLCRTCHNLPPNTPGSLSKSPRSPLHRHTDPPMRLMNQFAIGITTLLALAAVIVMSVSYAGDQGTKLTIALRNLGIVNPVLNMGKEHADGENKMGWEEVEIRGLAPRYLRGYAWTGEEQSHNPSVEYSLRADPLPDPPASVFANRDVADLVNIYPQRFKITTPINVDRFEQLLEPHPNRPFVESVIKGLREGFWPYAKDDSDLDGVAIPNHPSVSRDVEVLRAARDHELEMGRFSEPFDKLLPGMRTSPLGLVPKPNSDKFCLITDHSAGPNSLNSLISREDVSVHYDNLRDLASSLLTYRAEHGDEVLLLWKSDIAEAFRLLPVHPYWQTKQIVEIDGKFYADHNLVFGSRASPKVWCAFASLVGWIALYHLGINPIQHYMDDFWSFWKSPRRSLYRSRLLPDPQVRFLNLLDELGIPHKPEKQVYGHRLTIIGFEVDANAMSITLAEDKKKELVERIRKFVAKEIDPKTGCPMYPRPTLREWQQMLGELNWALNILPLARPGLNSSYWKISSQPANNRDKKSHAKKSRGPHTRIYHNKTTVHDLLWFASRLEASNGIHLIHSQLWAPHSAQRVAYVDACLDGLGIFLPPRDLGEKPIALYCRLDGDPIYSDIFHNEMLAILCALLYYSNHPEPNLSRILIRSDSLDSVQTFHSLGTNSPGVSPVLIASADVIMDNNFIPRVLHISGKENVDADCISRGLFTPVYGRWPSLQLFKINPPRDALGGRRL